ncbi:hypothetical protein LYSIN_02662 [Lysinibacillus sphaericus]|uniref:Uncharacterized protein n=1 Tax=Lysinibacillus sphaericus TaxID=1421 RepID=A0A2S5D4F4_LYSSH|nr:hypothetical protein LYSIN_02662 [Lysinibacillus sphaericus]
MWMQNMVETPRGNFEYFKMGKGEPLCITHQYTAFNSNGNIFAAPFTTHYTVYLINLRGSTVHDEVSFKNSVQDLEAIRSALGFAQWNAL